MLSALILAPFFSLIILNLPFRKIRRIAFGWVVLLIVLQIFLVIIHPFTLWSAYPDALDPFFNFEFSVDSLTLIMLLCIGIVVLTSVVFNNYSTHDEEQKFNFNSLILLLLTGMNATVLVNDIFSLYVFLEITAVTSFILIAMKKDIFAVEGTIKYLMLSILASVFMLSSIAIFVLTSGGTSFTAICGAFGNSENVFLLKIAVGLFLCCAFIKAGVAPFHGWLPDAHSSAPTPASVLLSGIVVKASGIYILLRLTVSVFTINTDIQNALMFIGTFSIIIGALAALTQSNFKRMLAYSTVSQMGYIILAVGCYTPLAIAGAVFHLFNHAMFKSLLFVNAGSVEKQLGTLDIEKMGGLAEKMPFTGISSIIASLSAAGVPPLSGFWSKLIIIIALWNSGRIGYASIVLLSSIATLAYLLVLQSKVFFGKLGEGLGDVKETHLGIVFSEVLLAIIILGVGLGFPIFFNTWILPIQNIMR